MPAPIVNSQGAAAAVNITFTGNGGLIFANNQTSYVAGNPARSPAARSSSAPATRPPQASPARWARAPPSSNRVQRHDRRGQSGLHALRLESGHHSHADGDHRPQHPGQLRQLQRGPRRLHQRLHRDERRDRLERARHFYGRQFGPRRFQRRHHRHRRRSSWAIRPPWKATPARRESP